VATRPVLAVIPARGGSKGLPGKNVRLLAGLPLIAHSIRFASLCPEIDYCVISTDSEEIAAVAREHGGKIPFLRPAELAADDTPMWPVVQHALREMEQQLDLHMGSVLLLQPTSPARLPEDVARTLEILESDPAAAGVVAVSEPHFHPRWTCVEEQGGYMRKAFPEAERYVRRQDVPRVYRINGLLYLWRRDHVCRSATPAYDETPNRMLVVPESRAVDIDTPYDFAMMELLLRERIIELPWLP
jgi:CMP-N-acetylneuraminic acid synthetase